MATVSESTPNLGVPSCKRTHPFLGKTDGIIRTHELAHLNYDVGIELKIFPRDLSHLVGYLASK